MPEDEKVISLVERSEEDVKAHEEICTKILRELAEHGELRSIVIAGVCPAGVISNYHMGERSNVFELIGSLEMLKRRIMEERTERFDVD